MTLTPVPTSSAVATAPALPASAPATAHTAALTAALGEGSAPPMQTARRGRPWRVPRTHSVSVTPTPALMTSMAALASMVPASAPLVLRVPIAKRKVSRGAALPTHSLLC